MKTEVDKQLDEMLQAGIIAENDVSPWTSPIIMASKSNGKWRFCADMCRINAQSETLYQELPGLDDVVDLVSQNHATFYQLSLTEVPSIKTTFVTPHRGSYKFLRTPRGTQTVHIIVLRL